MGLLYRPRRLRGTPLLREMVRETRIGKSALIYPVFVKEGHGVKEEIPSMPGQYRYSPDTLGFAVEEAQQAGVNSLLLFGLPACKDETGSGAWDEKGVVQQALRAVKRDFPQVYCIGDVCLCEYTSHGHCGLMKGEQVDNDSTLPLLAKTALVQVQAGADMVAPSDMMDGHIRAIREVLDGNGFSHIPIMGYSAKYASHFYGPFREAAGSAPAFGDRKSYQMDYHNRREAIKEAALDVEEGADILMVKPALAYLDVIRDVSQAFDLPLAAYSVSGEYAMIKAAAAAGYLDEEALVCETAVSVFRAGAQILITYYAKELARFLDEGRIG